MRTTLMFAALALMLGLLIESVKISNAQQSTDPRVADIVGSGKLRVGLGITPGQTWAVKNPKTGELKGVAADLARALASRLGVQMVPVEYGSPSRVPDGVKQGAWDVGFLGVNKARAAVVDYAPPYMQIDATYLVPAGSSIRSIGEADRAGVRIATVRRSVEESVLKRIVKRAELRVVETIAAGAAPRPALIRAAARLPGSRVLEDRFHATFAAMAVPKGQGQRLAYISEFIEQAKASGLVRQAIERARLQGVRVAPPGPARLD